ncbi:Coiled-coil domain-containing protein 96 [Oopsacas minuta]|uniref:Coiled-coil domain-containing protein 96 n=1 Tax=Oopsacas minuta TaxID=111878 RepID=A0AAV7JXN5_9METZ|nr:Coiled-coil domain-containing protein 96 [Oopsacas minuta]
MSETKLETHLEDEVTPVEDTAVPNTEGEQADPSTEPTTDPVTEPEHVDPVLEPEVETTADPVAEQETDTVSEDIPKVESADPPSDTTVPTVPSSLPEVDVSPTEEVDKPNEDSSIIVPIEETSFEMKTSSGKSLTEPHPTLADIREEVESPGTTTLTTKSYDNLDQTSLVVVTSFVNLNGNEDIPEIRPSTPRVADESAEPVRSEEELGGADDMADLLEELNLLKEEEEKAASENSQLQHKLVEHFRSKRSDERVGTAGDVERERGVTDYEQRYDKYLSVLQERQAESEKMKEYSDMLLETACETERERGAELESVFKEDGVHKRDSMLAAIDSRTGRQMTVELVEKILSDEIKKGTEVRNIRLENIKLSRNLGKKEEQLRQKEEVAEGLHMIEFEQLKIEHQKNNERCEDKNEDINRLRGKITRTVQVLTHIKEKLHFVANENGTLREQLADSDIQVSLMRDRLTYVKQSRDKLRGDNLRHQEKGGLVNQKKLLRDLEDRNDLSTELEARLGQLRKRHAELGQLSAGIKQKITQAKVSGSFSVLQVPH